LQKEDRIATDELFTPRRAQWAWARHLRA
jgi:hypothetical protein